MLLRLPLQAMLTGLLLLWVGERALSDTPRWVVDGLGVLALFTSITLAAVRYASARDERRVATRALLLHYLLCVLAILVYVLQTPEVGLLPRGDAQTLVNVLWPTLAFLGIAPAIALELAMRSAEQAPKLEIWRVRLAARAATIIALGVIAFAGINYTASRWNRKIDLSYFAPTKVGGSNAKIVETITAPLTFYLFFPPGNDVAEYARSFVDELAAESPLAQVQLVDQPRSPDLSRRLKVRANGYLVIESQEINESIRLGLDLEAASSALRRLDEDVQEKLLKVLRPARLAYFTTGHSERDYAPPTDDKRLGLSDFKQVLETLGFKIKRLGLGGGLGSQIPEDATVVIVPGPIEPFSAPEREALHRYLDGGGRVIFFMDPDNGTTDPELLAPLGIQVESALVATSSKRFLWRLEGQGESPYHVATAKASRHPSSETLASSAGRLAVVLKGAGHIVKLDQPPPDLDITMTVRTMSDHWADINGNGAFDENNDEKLSSWDIGVAIERAPKSGEDGPAAAAMRAIVYSDADFIGNTLVRNQGNYAVVMDGLRWLAGDEKNAGTIESEKDVRIVHRKDEDAIWFYGTSLVAPLFVLVGGLWFVRFGRRRSQP